MKNLQTISNETQFCQKEFVSKNFLLGVANYKYSKGMLLIFVITVITKMSHVSYIYNENDVVVTNKALKRSLVLTCMNLTYSLVATVSIEETIFISKRTSFYHRFSFRLSSFQLGSTLITNIFYSFCPS